MDENQVDYGASFDDYNSRIQESVNNSVNSKSELPQVFTKSEVSGTNTIVIYGGIILMICILAAIGVGVMMKFRKKVDIEDIINNPTWENQMVYVWNLNGILNTESMMNNPAMVFNDFIFGGMNVKTSAILRRQHAGILKKWWDVHSREDAISIIESTLTDGHTNLFINEINKFSDFDILIEQAGLSGEFSADKEKLQKIGLLSWDYVRVIGVLGHAYNAGFISKEECYPVMIHIGQTLQKNYDSYQEMASHYYWGHLFWTLSHKESKIIKKVISRRFSQKKGSWNVIPFEYDLTQRPI